MKGMEPTVFIVDDDQAVRDSLAALLETVGLKVETYASGQAFLDAYAPSYPGCLLLDVRMPGMGGLTLQAKLAEQQASIPIIFMTGHADVSMAVRAMKAGAFDFIEKPFKDDVIIESVQHAMEHGQQIQKRKELAKKAADLLTQLTTREREVLEWIVL